MTVKNKAFELIKKGFTDEEIANQLNSSKSYISRVRSEYNYANPKQYTPSIRRNRVPVLAHCAPLNTQSQIRI